MGKIKLFIDCYISSEACNLRCHYCYITQHRRFLQKPIPLKYPPEIIRKAFSKERLGGACVINICASGETLLTEDILFASKALLEEGHYVMIVTNGTLKNRFEEIAKWPIEIRKRLMIKFSFHYLEMERLNMFDTFFYNVNLMKENKVSFTVEVTPSDELIPYIDKLKNMCIERVGAMCHLTVARNEITGFNVLSDLCYEDYKKTWSIFDSELFRFKSETFYVKRKEFCYAGVWSYVIDLINGDLYGCNYERKIGNIFDNIDKPFPQKPVGCHCAMPHCYNSHAFLTFGAIPELKTPCYAEVRNRVCADNTEWLTPEVKEFFSSRLCESNREYNAIEKFWFETKYQSKRIYFKFRATAGKIRRKLIP